MKAELPHDATTVQPMVFVRTWGTFLRLLGYTHDYMGTRIYAIRLNSVHIYCSPICAAYKVPLEEDVASTTQPGHQQPRRSHRCKTIFLGNEIKDQARCCRWVNLTCVYISIMCKCACILVCWDALCRSHLLEGHFTHYYIYAPLFRSW
jgi:hypothetical protein